jgi:hypothetical protein
MFLVTAPDQVPPSASIKVSDQEFETLPFESIDDRVIRNGSD